MKTLIKSIAISAFIGCVTTTNALVVTNGVLANATAPEDPIALKCWNWNAGQATAIGYKVFVTVTRLLPKEISYMGETYKAVKYVDAPGYRIRFVIVDKPLPSWAPCATNTPTGMANEFPVIVVSSGVGCKSTDGVDCDTDGTKYPWGTEAVKRWGTAQAVRVGPGTLVNWKMGNSQGATGDNGGSTFNANGEFLGPISAFSNPTTRTSWAASAFIGPHIHLVDEYMRPPSTTPE